MAIRTDYASGEQLPAADVNEWNTTILSGAGGVSAGSFFQSSSLFEPICPIYTDDAAYLTFAINSPDLINVIDSITGTVESRNVTSDWAAATLIRGLVKISSFLYVLLSDGTNSRVYRYSATDLASGGILMTLL